MLVRFFSFASRSGVARWSLWFVAAVVIVRGGAWLLTVADGVAVVAIYATFGIVAAKLATEAVRRLHDVNQSAWLALATGSGIAALLGTAAFRWFGHGPDPVAWTAATLAIVAAAVLLLRPGNRRSNRYGEPVHAIGPTRGEPVGAAGAVLAFVLLGIGIAAGWGVRQWQADMASERDARMRRAATAEQPAPPVAGMSIPDAADARMSNRIDALLNDGAAR